MYRLMLEVFYVNRTQKEGWDKSAHNSPADLVQDGSPHLDCSLDVTNSSKLPRLGVLLAILPAQSHQKAAELAKVAEGTKYAMCMLKLLKLRIKSRQVW